MRRHTHFVVMNPGLRALLLVILLVVVYATPKPNETGTNASPLPTATLSSTKASCHARPPSCALQSKTKTICSPYADHKKSWIRFCRELKVAYRKKATKCKPKNRSRFSTLFVLCLRKCAVVRQAARAAAKTGVPFGSVVTITGRLYRKNSGRKRRQGRSGRWICRHRRTQCPRCCGSRWWCPRWK